MSKKFESFWISQAGIIIKDNKILILELASQPGYWDIPGGRIDVGEGNTSIDAFRREIKEELGVKNFDIIDLVDYDIWYVQKNGQQQGICVLIFLIDNLNTYDIKLSHEHLQYKWVGLNELSQKKFFWPRAIKMLIHGYQKYLQLKNK